MQKALIVSCLCICLAGCSIDPGATWAPDALKARAPAVPVLEAPPDVRLMLQTRLGEFFLPSAAPTNISFSAPKKNDLDWSVCIKATVNGAAGGTLGEQTYLVNIENNKPMRNANVTGALLCRNEQYERQ